MITSESLPDRSFHIFAVAKRFQKFLVVGTLGLAVNQVMLLVFHDVVNRASVLRRPCRTLVLLRRLGSLPDRARSPAESGTNRSTGPSMSSPDDRSASGF